MRMKNIFIVIRATGGMLARTVKKSIGGDGQRNVRKDLDSIRVYRTIKSRAQSLRAVARWPVCAAGSVTMITSVLIYGVLVLA